MLRSSDTDLHQSKEELRDELAGEWGSGGIAGGSCSVHTLLADKVTLR